MKGCKLLWIKDQAKAHHMTEDEVVENVMLVKQAVKEFVPEEAIAEMALLLAKDSSTTISGTTFVWMVDGVHNKLVTGFPER